MMDAGGGDDDDDAARILELRSRGRRSQSVGAMALPDEASARESAVGDERRVPAAAPHKRVSESRRDLDQIPRSQRLQKRQKSPIGLSLVQLEEIGLLDPRGDGAARSPAAVGGAGARFDDASPAAPASPAADRVAPAASAAGTSRAHAACSPKSARWPGRGVA